MKALDDFPDGAATEVAADDSHVRVAALVYLLSRKYTAASAPTLTRMALDHLDLLAADPNVSAVLRTTCGRIARQWREANGVALPPDARSTSLH